MITREHVETLLRSDAHDPVLIVLAGQALIVSATELGEGPYDGAVEIVSRGDLVTQLAADLTSERGVDVLAAQLDAMVTQLGG